VPGTSSKRLFGKRGAGKQDTLTYQAYHFNLFCVSLPDIWKHVCYLFQQWRYFHCS